MWENFLLPDRVQEQIEKARKTRKELWFIDNSAWEVSDHVSEEVGNVLETWDRKSEDPITWFRENPDQLPVIWRPKKNIPDQPLKTKGHNYPIETAVIQVNTRINRPNTSNEQDLANENTTSKESIKWVWNTHEIINTFELDCSSAEELGDSIHLLSLKQRKVFFDHLYSIVIEKNLQWRTYEKYTAIANALSDSREEKEYIDKWLKSMIIKKWYKRWFRNRAHKFAKILWIDFSETEWVSSKKLVLTTEAKDRNTCGGFIHWVDAYRKGIIEKDELVKRLSELHRKDMKAFLEYIYNIILFRQWIIYEEFWMPYEEKLKSISWNTTLELNELQVLWYARNTVNNRKILWKHIDSLLKFL